MIFSAINNFMAKFNLIKPFFLLSLILVFLSSCEALKYKKVSAKDYPPDPKERVRKNIETMERQLQSLRPRMELQEMMPLRMRSHPLQVASTHHP